MRLQGSEGTKDPEAGPRVYRHTIVPPLPGIDRTSDGLLDIPEEIMTWKGSIFSIYSNQVADWHGSGYGPLLETPSVRVPRPRSYKEASQPCRGPVVYCFAKIGHHAGRSLVRLG